MEINIDISYHNNYKWTKLSIKKTGIFLGDFQKYSLILLQRHT